MLCLYPIDTVDGLKPCRQCMNCRINLQRVWASRIQIEALWTNYSTFVTLTYNEEHVPYTLSGDPDLCPRHLKNFLNKFRRKNGQFRYFACGEYGDQTLRPHYHLIMFGISEAWEQQIQEAWTDADGNEMGFISTAELNAARAAYIAQYCVKKMTKKGEDKLYGRHPEFSRMSNQPGIGNPGVPWLADQHRTRAGSKVLVEKGDVFTSIRIDGRIWPLGSYMRTKIRENLGVPEKAADRAIMFDKVHEPEPGEWASQIIDFCPDKDLAEISIQGKMYGKKTQAEDLPEIRKKADKAKRRRKRNAKNDGKV